jgi:hypothetical protein
MCYTFVVLDDFSYVLCDTTQSKQIVYQWYKIQNEFQDFKLHVTVNKK